MPEQDDHHDDEEWDVDTVTVVFPEDPAHVDQYVTVCSLCGLEVLVEHDELGTEVWVHQ